MINRHLKISRHRADRFLYILSGNGEKGIHQIIDGYLRLPDHPSEIFIFSQPPWPICRKVHNLLLVKNDELITSFKFCHSRGGGNPGSMFVETEHWK
jgi:hypothetical protein